MLTANRRSLLAGILALFATLAFGHFRSTPYNNYVLLADALLHGHTWIVWPGAYIDALAYHGQRYVIEAPVPALLLLPYVALAGTNANQTLEAATLCGTAVGAGWKMCESLGLSIDRTFWLTLFLFAGTSLLWCAMLGDVWFIAHVSAVAFTLLALLEVFGARRGWLAALWAVAAAGSRFSLALAIPVYAFWLWKMRGRRALTSFALVVLAAAIVWMLYNRARFGTFADIGYTLWYHQDSAGMPSGSPFRLSYLPYQLWSFFVQYPAFTGNFPFLRPSFSGVALTWTSPALIFAFWARRPRTIVGGLWCAAALVALPSLLYYVNGYAQYGMRHALDFIPFLFVLMAFAAQRRFPAWTRVLIAYSCVANLYGVWYWNAFVRPGN